MKLLPLSNIVIIAPEAAALRRGTLIVPEAFAKAPRRGRVIDMGPECVETRVGARVVYAPFRGTTVEHDGEAVMLLREEDVLAEVQ